MIAQSILTVLSGVICFGLGYLTRLDEDSVDTSAEEWQQHVVSALWVSRRPTPGQVER
jgi:hypothetical protein